jgi:hypothetical protein
LVPNRASALDELRFLAHTEASRVDPAHGHIGGRARRQLGQVDQHEQLGRRERQCSFVAQAGGLLDNVGLRPADPARHLVVRAAAHHEGAIGRPGGSHRGVEALPHRQHRHEHDHHAGNADDGDG